MRPASTDRLRAVPWRSLRADLALPAIERVLAGAAAEREIDRTLRAHRALSSGERTALVEAIFGVALWRRRLAVQAGSNDPRALLCALLRDLGDVEGDAAAALSGLAPTQAPGTRVSPAAMSSQVDMDARSDRSREPLTLAERWSLPDWLAALFERELGMPGAEAFAASICAPGPICLRANGLLCTREQLIAQLAREGVATRPAVLAQHGLVVTSARPNLLALPSYREGLFEVQDEGSQLVGALVGARPGDTVLDFCAGAGGKSLLLAADLGDRGEVIAHDVDEARLARLVSRAARAGATCIRTGPPAAADRVLVDAPCSELGTLRRGPDARWRSSEESAARMPALQRSLLDQAAPFARHLLVYATCTLRREENEDVALSFVRTHREFVRVPPSSCATDDGYFRCLPHLHGTDAFFAAVWERRSPLRPSASGARTGR